MTRLAAAAVLASLALGAPALARDRDPAATADGATLEISATGEVHVTPDQATVTLGVDAKAPTAAQAMHDDATQMAQVIGAVRGAGVPDKDIQTAGLSLAPQTVYAPNQPPKPDGYLASDTIAVTVENLGHLGAVIDAAADAGANQIQGVSFELKDRQGAENQARLAAVKTLQARAALYAEAAGLRLGRLVKLSEGGETEVEPVQPRVMMTARAATPIAPGEMTVQVTVSAVYELTR